MNILKAKKWWIIISREDCLEKYKWFKIEGRLVLNSQSSEYELYILFISWIETRKNFPEMFKLPIDELFLKLEKIYWWKTEIFFQFDNCKIDEKNKVLSFYDNK